MITARPLARPLTGTWLWIGRALWFAVGALTIGLFIIAIPQRFEQLQAICTGVACRDPQLSIDDIRVLQGLGLTRTGYAAYSVAVELAFAAIHFVIAAVIFARRSNDRNALLVSLMLMTFGPATFTGTMTALAQGTTGWQLPADLTSALSGTAPSWMLEAFSPWQIPVGFVVAFGQVCTGLFFFLFPDGRLVPKWGAFVILIWTAWQVPAAFLPGSILNAANWPQPIAAIVWSLFLGSFVFAQLYRYRSVSDPIRKQQTKWVVFGTTAALAGFYLATLLAAFLSRLSISGLLFRQAILTLAYLSMLLMPLSIALAILRSRLWEIDFIINRTVVYSLVTALLAALYFAIIFSLQTLLRLLTGQGRSAVLVAASTLIIAALFHPLRLRVQDMIDRRFYRSKYDAARVLSSFGTFIRDEVDLNHLAIQLEQVVQDTMEPSSVSLVLLGPDGHEREGKEVH